MGIAELWDNIWAEGWDERWFILSLSFILDLWIGDPDYKYHPTRLMGKWIERSEEYFLKRGWDGYVGGFFFVF